MRQAALALSDAHRAGMVHRDVKPGNLLVRRSDGAVKITDFGIARAADAVPLTQTGMVVGTAHYFSPEQAEGRVVGPATDVYSLGVVAYECLAGRRPFVADSPVAVALVQIRDEPPPLPPDVPAPVRALVLRVLAKDPRQRFGDRRRAGGRGRAVQQGRRAAARRRPRRRDRRSRRRGRRPAAAAAGGAGPDSAGLRRRAARPGRPRAGAARRPRPAPAGRRGARPASRSAAAAARPPGAGPAPPAEPAPTRRRGRRPAGPRPPADPAGRPPAGRYRWRPAAPRTAASRAVPGPRRPADRADRPGARRELPLAAAGSPPPCCSRSRWPAWSPCCCPTAADRRRRPPRPARPATDRARQPAPRRQHRRRTTEGQMTTPRLLGSRYEIGETLGHGGMAEVHRGRDVRLGRDVAVKVLRADLARDPSFQARFRREAQSAASLNHPAIVAVYDTGEEDMYGNLPYIVMEYVEGRTLRELLKTEGRLMPAARDGGRRRRLRRAGLQPPHGIVHRDIKPGERDAHPSGAVKVMDFGIARAVADNAATVTQTAAVIGTAQYLSPEQARGENVDARSDVYSTGVLLFELITGSPPFTGDSPVAVAYQHVRENAPPPSTLNPDVPPELDAIVLKAMAKNPANRYQSAGEMRADLIRAINGRPVAAEPVMLEDEVTTVLGGGAGRTGMYPATGYGGTAGGRSAPPPKRRSPWTWVAIALVGLLVLGIAALHHRAAARQRERARCRCPALVGKTQADANRLLAEAGLRRRVQHRAVHRAAEGQGAQHRPGGRARAEGGRHRHG